ncbi:MAG TPA: hypothetical protein VFF10_05080 [Trueperaceae bacterium]|nr:hypothetical protein [Trueperaceae bacterium]
MKTVIRAPRPSVAAVLAVVASLISANSLAQPYAASGGFGAPQEVTAGVLPVAAVAAGDGQSHLIWADGEGVWAEADGGEPSLLVRSDTVRGAWATVSNGDLAVAWVERDRRTGRTLHHLTYRGEDHLLFTHVQETPLSVGPGADGPWVAAPVREGGEAHLSVFAWDGDGPGEAQVVYATELAVRGMFAVEATDQRETGPAWISWLEGFTDMTALGPNAEWHAYVMRVGVAEPVDLGLADVIDERQTVALGTVEGEPASVMALWRAEEADLRASLMTTGPDGTLEVVRTVPTGEVGRPLAWVDEQSFWLDGPYLRRAAPLSDDAEPVSVAWSPELIADAALAHDESTGVTSLAWYGRRQGGRVALFASDDSVPFEPSLSDRVAAAMGWSPWNVGQEAAGQALTAAIVGIMGTVALAPLLFLLSLLLARSQAVRARPLVVGAWLGVVVPPLIVALVALRVPALGLLEPGPLIGLVVTLLIGAVVGHLITRGADREVQLHVLASSAATVLVGLTVWSFAYYRIWAPFVGL